MISSYFLLLLFFFFVSILISLFLSRPRVVPISRILPFFPYLDDRPLRHPSPFTLQHAARQVSAARTLHTCVLSVIPLFLLLLQFCKLQFLQLTLFVRLFFAIALFCTFFSRVVDSRCTYSCAAVPCAAVHCAVRCGAVHLYDAASLHMLSFAATTVYSTERELHTRLQVTVAGSGSERWSTSVSRWPKLCYCSTPE